MSRITSPKDYIYEALSTLHNIAVVGLSSKPERPSYKISKYMKQKGYRIIPVNPNETEVLGRHAYASLLDVKETIEIVNVFRRSEFIPEIVEQAIQMKARLIWMQEGVSHAKAAQRAREAGLKVVEDRCILKEHARKNRVERF